MPANIGSYPANNFISPQEPYSATALITAANTNYADNTTTVQLLAATYLLPPNPFTTVASSAVVTVRWPAHGLRTGDVFTLAGATAVGGITPSGAYAVTRVDADSFTITHGSNATLAATGGGSAVTAQDSRNSRNGLRITRLTGLARATTSALELQLFISPDGGTTKRFIRSVWLPAATVPPTTAANAGADFGFSEANPLIVAPHETMWVGASAALAGGIVIDAQGGAY